MTDQLDTVENLVARLAILLNQEPQMRTASRFNLETALRAASLRGVGGTLTIEIPRNTNGLVDITWSAGEAGAPKA